MKVLNLTSLFLSCIAFILASATTTTIAKELRFPNFPASFEEAIHKGKKGCFQGDPRVQTAIAVNEGMRAVGVISFIDNVSQGRHTQSLAYSPSEGYAYQFSNKFEGQVCIAERLTNMSFKEIGNYDATSIEIDGKFTSDQCKFTDRFGVLCGTFSRMAAGLINNGFRVQFQGVKQNGDVVSYFSNDAKTYELTTDDKTGATVITGSGDSVFEFNEHFKF